MRDRERESKGNKMREIEGKDSDYRVTEGKVGSGTW